MEKKIDLLKAAQGLQDPEASEEERQGFTITIQMGRPKGHHEGLDDRAYAKRLVKDGKAPKVRFGEDGESEIDPDEDEDDEGTMDDGSMNESMEGDAGGLEADGPSEASEMLRGCGLDPDEHGELVSKIDDMLSGRG